MMINRLLLTASFACLNLNALAQIPVPSPGNQIPVRTPPTTGPVILPDRIPQIRLPYQLTLPPVVVVNPINNRLPQVPASQLRTDTRITVGQYDQFGRVDGSTQLTVGEILRGLDDFKVSETQKYNQFALNNPRFANQKVIVTNEFDPQLNQNIEVIKIPMNTQHLASLGLQIDKFVGTPAGVVDEPELRDADYKNSGGYAQDLGNDYFGAFFGATFDTYNAKNNQKVHANAQGGGVAFGKRITILSFDAKSATGESAYMSISALGYKLWDWTSPSITHHARFERSEGARMRFWLGPVPLSVGASIGGALGAHFKIQALSGDKLVHGSLVPYLDTFGSVDAAVDAYIASAGVYGNLRIVYDSLPVSGYISYNLATETLKTTFKVENSFEALGGEVGIFAKVNYLVGSKKWTKALFAWQGFRDDRTLLNEDITIPLRDYIGYKYLQLGGKKGFLGDPISAELPTPNGLGRFRHFQGGSIYWSQNTGAKFIRGAIRQKWASLGWEASFLGFPTTDETATPDGKGRFNHFQGGSIYWHPNTGAFEIRGAIRSKWAQLGWEKSALGYPVTDETATPDGVGRYNHFQGGSIYWHPNTGAFEVRGNIRSLWANMGWERSSLGYPRSDETSTSDNVGRYNNFENGAIYWHPTTNAVAISSFPLAKYRSVQAEKSCLGYPKAAEFIEKQESQTSGSVKISRLFYKQQFVGGTLTWIRRCTSHPFGGETCQMESSAAEMKCLALFNPVAVVPPIPR